ncbi:MAG: RNA polymerase sigma factor SigZ [Proteobacteria bacterium]|nr:RNA polymerase sigma factor SigZ [Pseudomonadota bacterium]
MKSQITEQVWKDYHSKLHHFILNRIGNADDADDILQDVFLKIHSRIDTLKENNKIQSWIYQITRNSIIDYYRTRKPTKELPSTLTKPEPEPFAETRQEMAGWILPMIQSLPNQYKDALMLSEIEGMTQKEVAGKNGLSVSGAKSRIQRGRKMMKDMLLDCCQFEFDHSGTVLDYERKAPDCKNC